jgi:hypothetical protein
MKSVFILLSSILVLASSCHKSNDATSGEVWIRIENNTSVSMNDIKIGDAAYNNLTPQSTTEYKLISFPIYAAFCNFKVNGQDAWSGFLVCGTPPPPSLEQGYYTFKIGSTTTPNYYSMEVIKR